MKERRGTIRRTLLQGILLLTMSLAVLYFAREFLSVWTPGKGLTDSQRLTILVAIAKSAFFVIACWIIWPRGKDEKKTYVPRPYK